MVGQCLIEAVPHPAYPRKCTWVRETRSLQPSCWNRIPQTSSCDSVFGIPPSPHMTEEKREGGGRICVQRELSSRAAACWFMFMFMFMLACWLVVVSILVIPIASHNDKRLFQLSVVGRKLSAVSWTKKKNVVDCYWFEKALSAHSFGMVHLGTTKIMSCQCNRKPE